MTQLPDLIKNFVSEKGGLQGTVAQIHPSWVLIRLFNGKLVRAKLQTDLNVRVGDPGVLITGETNLFFPQASSNKATRKILV